MGARSNIVVHFSNGARIYLYTHWRGREVGEVVREGLRAAQGEGGRWKDEGVLCRALATRLWRGDEDELLGYSVSPYATWPDFDEFHLDLREQRVRRVEARSSRTLDEWGFHEFVERGAFVDAETPQPTMSL